MRSLRRFGYWRHSPSTSHSWHARARDASGRQKVVMFGKADLQRAVFYPPNIKYLYLTVYYRLSVMVLEICRGLIWHHNSTVCCWFVWLSCGSVCFVCLCVCPVGCVFSVEATAHFALSRAESFLIFWWSGGGEPSLHES